MSPTASSAWARRLRSASCSPRTSSSARATGELVAGRDLDERAQRPLRSGEHATLRWILLHLVEETARHNGHLDIVRELVDGVTGD
jgi:hypothetical protein